MRHMRRLQSDGGRRYVDSVISVSIGVVETLESTANFLARGKDGVEQWSGWASQMSRLKISENIPRGKRESCIV